MSVNCVLGRFIFGYKIPVRSFVQHRFDLPRMEFESLFKPNHICWFWCSPNPRHCCCIEGVCQNHQGTGMFQCWWANPFPLLCMTVTLFLFGVHLINCLQTFLIQIYHAHPQREACHPSGLTDINFWKNTKHLMSLSFAAGHFFPTANFCYQVFSTGLWHAQQDITLHFGSKNFCFVVFLHSQAIMRNIISEAAEGFVWIYVALVGLGFGFRQNIHVYVLGS